MEMAEYEETKSYLEEKCRHALLKAPSQTCLDGNTAASALSSTLESSEAVTSTYSAAEAEPEGIARLAKALGPECKEMFIRALLH